eukprot:1208238-Rhodomonas_salina.2
MLLRSRGYGPTAVRVRELRVHRAPRLDPPTPRAANQDCDPPWSRVNTAHTPLLLLVLLFSTRTPTPHPPLTSTSLRLPSAPASSHLVRRVDVRAPHVRDLVPGDRRRLVLPGHLALAPFRRQDRGLLGREEAWRVPDALVPVRPAPATLARVRLAVHDAVVPAVRLVHGAPREVRVVPLPSTASASCQWLALR